MLCAFPFCATDVDRLLDMLEWIGQLGKQKHPALLVADPATPWDKSIYALDLARKAFLSAEIKTLDAPVSGWITGSCAMFKRVAQEAKAPFLFMEPDAVPLKPTWLDEIQSAYERCGKPFMAPIISHQTKGLPSPYMEGIGVYPANVLEIMGSSWNPNQSWTLACASLVVPLAANTPLIKHVWGEKDRPPIFASNNIPSTNVFCLRQIPAEAVIWHRCKDGSLINCLRKQNGINQPIDLPNVTLWTAIWNNNKFHFDRTLRVLRYCLDLFKFGDVILFSNPPVPVNYGWRLLPCPMLNMQQWSIFINEEVPKHIKTEYALCVHEDGFPLRRDLWTDEFLKYDYIGAPWADKVVGNGGFFMESKKLMTVKQALPPNRPPVMNADMWICRKHRHTLIQAGIQFAPFDLAERFSSECTGHLRQTFGFHGRTVNRGKYQEGWRQIELFESKEESCPHIIYVYWNDDYARRFAQSFRVHDPGYDYILMVVCNDGHMDEKKLQIFKGLRFILIQGDNRGYDIGAYQKAAAMINSGLVIFFGQSTYFTGSNWLARMKEAWMKHGRGMYGSMGNQGVAYHHMRVYPHLRSTAFWMDVDLFNAYPHKVIDDKQRYPFEHGQNCLTQWVRKQGMKTMVVAWQGESDVMQCNSIPNGFHQGNQSNLLVGDRLTEPPHVPA